MSQEPSDSRTRPSRTPVTEHVVSWLQRQVAEGALVPGQRLPPERTLARVLGISRPTVRAGLRTLAAMHLIVSRRSVGTFVADGPPQLQSRPLGLLSTLHGVALADVQQARLLVEIEAAGLAAAKATLDDLGALADLVAEGFSATADERTAAAHDHAFHVAVAAASGNPVLALFVDIAARLQAEQRHQDRPPALRPKDHTAAHQRIYRALRARDAVHARAEMRAHLRGEESARPSTGPPVANWALTGTPSRPASDRTFGVRS